MRNFVTPSLACLQPSAAQEKKSYRAFVSEFSRGGDGCAQAILHYSVEDRNKNRWGWSHTDTSGIFFLVNKQIIASGWYRLRVQKEGKSTIKTLPWVHLLGKARYTSKGYFIVAIFLKG